MVSICLLTPGHLSTNPRLVKEADALARAGHRVSVIAADYLSWAQSADREFDGRPWKLVAKLPFGPGAPESRRVRQVITQRAARVLFGVGVRAPGVVRAAWHPVAPDLLRAALSMRADLYIAHYVAALPAAALAAGFHATKYAFDAEDFHLGDPPDRPEFDSARSLTRLIEERYLPGCSYVSAASPGIADAYAETYGIPRPHTLLNVFPLDSGPGFVAASGTWKPSPSIYWFSQTIGPDRGLECAVNAIGIARSAPHLVLRGNPSPGYMAKLMTVAARAGAGSRVHWLPPAMPGEMERLAALHDLGLVGETGHTPNRRVALTNKLFSFLLAGVPALLSDIPAHRRIASELGSAVRLYQVDDAAALAAAVDSLLLASPSDRARTRQVAFDLACHRYNWDVEQKKLLRLVEGAFECQP